MDKGKLIVKNSIVRIVGVFESSSKMKELHERFTLNNYSLEKISDAKTHDHHKNYWYPEFRDIYFFNREETSAKIYVRKEIGAVEFIKNPKRREDPPVQASVKQAELYLFKDELNFFSLDLEIAANSDLDAFSDLTYCARNFQTELVTDQERQRGKLFWVNWIEKHVLCGIRISSYRAESKVKVDDYSGSKFKLYTVLDLEEDLSSETRQELLYDVGSVAKIGSAGGNYHFTPSEAYFNELLENRISVFNNYDILPMFDSFTVIGNGILHEDWQYATWSQSYFRIYLHNLFIKFSLFRYNSEMVQDSVKVRDQFETFLNNYNIGHLSYNFLPNLIYQKHRNSLDIESEIEMFQDRINRISQSIQEEQQKRSNVLLAIVGVFTSIASAEPIFTFLESSRMEIHWDALQFYALIAILLIILSIPVLLYLFPERKKKIVKRIRQRRLKG